MAERLQIPADRMSVVPLGINVTGYAAAAPARRRVPRRLLRPRGAGEGPARAGRRLPALPRAPAGRRRRCAARPRATWRRSVQPYLDSVQGGVRGRRAAASEFTYRGTLDRGEKINFLRGLDLLSVPATYDEPKGIFLLEAMACGVPVVQPRRGAFTEVVERTGGGVLVEPDDPDSLAEALSSCGPTGRGWRRWASARSPRCARTTPSSGPPTGCSRSIDSLAGARCSR